MLKNSVIALCLMIIGSAIWIPAEVHALYIQPKTTTCDCVLPNPPQGGLPRCSFCTGGSVIASGEGNTQGANTSVFVALQVVPNPTPGGPIGKLTCFNHGENSNITSNAFNINATIQTGAVSSETVQKNGKFTFLTGGILPDGIHRESTWTSEDCFNDPACKAWQDFCPNGVLNDNEKQSKNWVPRDFVPFFMLAQEFLYYCDSQTGKDCPCDPRMDAGTGPISGNGPISGDLGPANRCATATSTTKTSTNTWTFAWTNVSGPPPTRNMDSQVDHFDIVPGAKSDMFMCSMSLENQQLYSLGAELPYDCVKQTAPDFFPF